MYIYRPQFDESLDGILRTFYLFSLFMLLSAVGIAALNE